jgi:hypothetical protein
VSPLAAFAMAFRSEPGPLSFVLATVTVAPRIELADANQTIKKIPIVKFLLGNFLLVRGLVIGIRLLRS